MLDQAEEMMSFAADLLGYKLPPFLPDITITPHAPVLGQYQQLAIRLKYWRHTPEDEGVLVHELTHHIQYYHGTPYCEREAITAQIRWLQRVDVGVDSYPSRAAILKMTGCPEFASLSWL